jgi:prepilin-type N-terminal cleavage/methylation domain-containing protein
VKKDSPGGWNARAGADMALHWRWKKVRRAVVEGRTICGVGGGFGWFLGAGESEGERYGVCTTGWVMRGSKRRAGFTLIEMMIAVMIIGVMAVAAAPSFSATLADSRQRSAAVDLLRLANKARSLALASGLAHLLRIRGAGDQAGTAMVYAGLNGRCSQTPWETIAFVELNGHGPIETLDMASYNPTGGGYVIVARALQDSTALDELWICYQPNGETWSRIPPVTDLALKRQLATYAVVVVRRLGSSTDTIGMDRSLQLSPGASPWIH